MGIDVFLEPASPKYLCTDAVMNLFCHFKTHFNYMLLFKGIHKYANCSKDAMSLY